MIKTRAMMTEAEREQNDREWTEDQARLAAEPPMTSEQRVKLDAELKAEFETLSDIEKQGLWEHMMKLKQ